MPKKLSFSMNRGLLKKLTKSLGYYLSPQVVAIILMITMIFLLSGGIYALSVSLNPYLLGEPSEPLIRSIIIETITIMLIYALGAASLLLVYRSVKYRYNPSQASLLIKIGAAMLIIVFIVLELSIR